MSVTAKSNFCQILILRFSFIAEDEQNQSNTIRLALKTTDIIKKALDFLKKHKKEKQKGTVTKIMIETDWKNREDFRIILKFETRCWFGPANELQSNPFLIRCETLKSGQRIENFLTSPDKWCVLNWDHIGKQFLLDGNPDSISEQKRKFTESEMETERETTEVEHSEFEWEFPKKKEMCWDVDSLPPSITTTGTRCLSEITERLDQLEVENNKLRSHLESKTNENQSLLNNNRELINDFSELKQRLLESSEKTVSLENQTKDLRGELQKSYELINHLSLQIANLMSSLKKRNAYPISKESEDYGCFSKPEKLIEETCNFEFRLDDDALCILVDRYIQKLRQDQSQNFILCGTQTYKNILRYVQNENVKLTELFPISRNQDLLEAFYRKYILIPIYDQKNEQWSLIAIINAAGVLQGKTKNGETKLLYMSSSGRLPPKRLLANIVILLRGLAQNLKEPIRKDDDFCRLSILSVPRQEKESDSILFMLFMMERFCYEPIRISSTIKLESWFDLKDPYKIVAPELREIFFIWQSSLQTNVVKSEGL